MANTLKQAVVQYDVNNLPQRLIVQYVDDQTNEEKQEIIERDSMGNPDVQIFDNFKNLVEQHML